MIENVDDLEKKRRNHKSKMGVGYLEESWIWKLNTKLVLDVREMTQSYLENQRSSST